MKTTNLLLLAITCTLLMSNRATSQNDAAPMPGADLGITCATLISQLGNPITTVPSGQHFVLHIEWSISSVGGIVKNPKITVTIPPELNRNPYGSSNPTGVQILPSDWTPDPYTGNGVLVFTHGNQLAAGSNGVIELNLGFRPAVTPNGTQACIGVAFEADDVNPPNPRTTQCCVTAIASPKWFIQKVWLGGNAVDGIAYYAIDVYEELSGMIGGVNMQSAYVLENLPAGAQIAYDQFAGTANEGAMWQGQYRWTFNQSTAPFPPPGEVWLTGMNVSVWHAVIGIRYTSPTYSAGNSVTNTASLCGIPLGETNLWCTTDDATITLAVPTAHATATKSVTYGTALISQGIASIGCPGRYRYAPKNDGNMTLTPMKLVDHIPPELKVTKINSGYYTEPGGGTGTVVITVRSNISGDPPYVSSALSWTANQELDPYLDLGLPTDRYVAEITWDFGTVPPGWASAYGLPYVKFVILGNRWDGSPVHSNDNVTNNGEVSWTANNVPGSSPFTLTFSALDVQPVISITKSIASDSPPGPYLPGSIVKFTIKVLNQGSDELENCIITDVLPDGFSYYVDPSMPAGYSTSSQCAPTGNQQVPFTFAAPAPGDPQVLTWTAAQLPTPVCGETCTFYLSFFAKVDDYAPPGVYTNAVTITGTNHGPRTAYANIPVNVFTRMNAVKAVKGELDQDFSTAGSTVPGGNAVYRLTVTNEGNTKLTDFCITDIFPYANDHGVYNSDPRGSTWTPFLTQNFSGSVTNNFAIYFHSSSGPDLTCPTVTSGTNPWLDDASFLSANSLQAVRSIRLQSNPGFFLDPGQSMDLEWTMQAPPGTPTGMSQLACNSFGIVASSWHNTTSGGVTDVLPPAEPQKVCLAVLEGNGALIGNYVWKDLNANGLQDDGAASGMNGVTVELYDASNNTLAAPPHVTTNDNSGDPGYFEFVEPPGTYYLKVIPPAGYHLTAIDAGNDAVDSDGNPMNNGTTMSFPVTFTSVALNWDFGLVPDGPPVDTVCGTKFNDLNHNGVRDGGEPGIPNWQITLTASGGAQSTIATDEDGHYCFNNVDPGTYTISEEQRGGWTQSFPSEPGTHSVTLPSTVPGAFDFGNYAICDDLIEGVHPPDPFTCTYDFIISSALASPVTSIAMTIDGGTLESLTTTGCPFSPPIIPYQSAYAINFAPACVLPLSGSLSVLPAAFAGTVTISFTIMHADQTVCVQSVSYVCCRDETPCDSLYFLPFIDEQLTHDYRRFFVVNLEGSPITSIDVALSPQLPVGSGCPGWYDGGNLVDDGVPNPTFYFPYTVIPSDYPPATLASGNQLVEFNIGIEWFCHWTGQVNLTVHHADGRICLLSYGPWIVDNPHGDKIAHIETRPKPPKKYVAGSITVKNLDAKKLMQYVSISTENPQDTIVAVSAPDLKYSKDGVRSSIITSRGDYNVDILLDLRIVPSLPPGASTDPINIVVARDSALAGSPVLRVSTFDTDGNPLFVDSMSLSTPVSHLLGDAPAESMSLLGSFPDPAKGTTTINFLLSRGMTVRLEICNDRDECVELLAEGYLEGGIHTVRYDPAALPAGAYHLRLSSGGNHVTAPINVAR